MFHVLLQRLTRGVLPGTIVALALGGCGGSAATVPTPPPVAPTASPETAPWVRGDFEPYWNIEYPADWAIFRAAQDGNLFFQGEYNQQTYVTSFTYPGIDFSSLPGVTTDTLTLDAWVTQEIGKITPAPGAKPAISDITVSGAPAKKVLLGAYGWAYILKHGDKNPRVISVGQPGSSAATTPPDLEELLDRLVAGVK